MEQKTWVVLPEQAGQRLDRYLSEAAGVTRAAAQGWLETGCVDVGGVDRPKNYKIKAGDLITLRVPDPVSADVLAEDIPLEIVYEDGDLLVVNKPRGMVVHPAAGHTSGTLVNALLAHCGDSLSGINGVLRPGIVHRIDKDTSGLLIVAKNDRAHQGLAAQIKAHTFTRVYEAVVRGHMKSPSGTVDAPIGRHPAERKRMAVVATNSRPARTHYETIAEYPGYAHLRLRLETGRTHQIRVHMAHLGHPVAGDPVYGGRVLPGEPVGQCLHAKEIGFVHPVTGESLYFTSDLPGYFTDFLAALAAR
ncbi:MAG: RluA family pseudouridine synthase [Acutalibacteraceae bacterium]|jgi:23S rRNA pseudouridine1911/1915/1917 synthase